MPSSKSHGTGNPADTRPYPRHDPVERRIARSVPVIPIRTAASVSLLGLAGATGYQVTRGGLKAAFTGPGSNGKGGQGGADPDDDGGSKGQAPLFNQLGDALGIPGVLLGLAALGVTVLLVAKM